MNKPFPEHGGGVFRSKTHTHTHTHTHPFTHETMPGKSSTSVHKVRLLNSHRRKAVKHTFLSAEMIKRMLREHGLSRSNPELRDALLRFAEERAKEIVTKSSIVVLGKRQRKVTKEAVDIAYASDRSERMTVVSGGRVS